MTTKYRAKLERRFRAKVLRNARPRTGRDGRPLTPCHEWKRATDNPKIWVEDRLRPASHVAFFVEFGFWPKQLNHICNNRRCVRVGHAYPGTQRQNMQDAVRDGRAARGDRSGARLHPDRVPRGDRNGLRKHPERAARGERHGLAKLTEPDVLRIREWTRRGRSQKWIAGRLGVGRTAVGNVLRGRTWRHA